MPYLAVPGADLYYETIGSGPLLVTISGANGSAEIWRPFAAQLQSNFAVCIYDRRGFSRSYLTGSQDYAHRLETDADDVGALIKHLSPNEPATVFGNSSGALVSLMVLTRHSDLVHTLIPHEPPSYPFLDPEACQYITSGISDMYEMYRQHGPIPAFELFAKLGHLDSPEEKAGLLAAFDPRRGPFIAGNVLYWFERELRQYTKHEFDIEVLRSLKEKLVLVNGRDSHREAPHRLANVCLGEKLEMEVLDWSGMHLGFASHAEEFAEEFKELMKRRREP